MPADPTKGIDAFDEANQACSVMHQYGQHQCLAYAAQSTETIFNPCSLDLPSVGALIGFYHACLGFPVKQTWLDAAKAGNCNTFDGLMYSNIAQYCPDADETILGHLAQQRQNIRSTQPRPARAPTGLPSPVIEPSPPAIEAYKLFLNICPLANFTRMTKVVFLSRLTRATSIL